MKLSYFNHPRACGDPVEKLACNWVPAYAGMTVSGGVSYAS